MLLIIDSAFAVYNQKFLTGNFINEQCLPLCKLFGLLDFYLKINKSHIDKEFPSKVLSNAIEPTSHTRYPQLDCWAMILSIT
jgi:hypothetical protein